MTVIADTSFVYGLLDREDKNHSRCRAYYLHINERVLIPAVALTEVAYHLHALGGNKAVARGFRELQSEVFSIVDLNSVDYSRALVILEKYHDTRIDFVDACIMALAERLQLKRILTFDHRDFGIFRPEHIERFELLP
jgi:uncharacterized protein